MSQATPAQATSSGDMLNGTPEALPWFVKELKDVKPEARELFENYSHVAPDDVVPHIQQFRDRAFTIFPYPCLGRWGFLDLSISQSPSYHEVLERVKAGEHLLDIGCCIGQDLRKLIHDGAPSENTHGADLKSTFWDVGFDLFLDKSSLKTTFMQADIFDMGSGLKQLDGKMDIVHAASFFHLFDWDQQVQAAKRVTRLLKPAPGSLIFGRQGGTIEARNTGGDAEKNMQGNKRFSHNPESLVKMWKQVGDETGTEWKVDASFGDESLSDKAGGKTDLIPADMRWLLYSVRRV